MNVDIVVAVWGDWHVRALETCTLPSALAAGNLPVLANRHQCRLRVFTRRADVDRLRNADGLRRASSLMPVTVDALTEERDVSAPHHLKWWHEAGEEAKARQAVVINLPPDVVFTDVAVANLVEPLAQGKVAVLAPPQLRVVEETLLGDLRNLTNRRTGAITLTPRETVALGMRHLHPLFAEVVEGNPYGRPGIEHLWPVGNEGFVLCQTTREIISYNPAVCDITDRFLVSNVSGMESVHSSTSAEDAFFLSLAPLMKDFGLVVPHHPVTARFLARWSTHPDNDVPLADYLPEHIVRLEGRAPTPSLWAGTEVTARKWVAEYLQWRKVFHLWRAAREAGCNSAAKLIGLAAHVLDMPRLLENTNPIVAQLPSDAAMEGVLEALASPGGEPALESFLRVHLLAERVPPGHARPTVTVGACHVYAIDTLLSPGSWATPAYLGSK